MAEKPHFCSVENVGFVSGRVLVFRLQAREAWLTYDKVCKNYSTASVTEDIFNPTFNTEKESIDVGLVITVNYNKLYNIIPIIEVDDKWGPVHLQFGFLKIPNFNWGF